MPEKSKPPKDTDLGITVKKSEDFSEWYSQVCAKADLSDLRYGIQGFLVHKTWAIKIIRKIYDLLENEVERDWHEPVLFPIAIPEHLLTKEKEHVEGFAPEVFWITEAGKNKLEEKFALRPTSETAFYSMYSLWIRSHNDLPFKKYQSRMSVYRYEPTTRPFLRGREFLFFETHDAFKSEEDALAQVKRDMGMMQRVVAEKLGIPFLFFRRPDWDKFAGANDTYAADAVMPDGRVNQIGSTHYLGTRFAKAFGVKYMDADGTEKYVHLTCFGPGIWRIMAGLIGIHGDDKGLILPPEVAPVQVVIVPILFKDTEKKVIEKCKELLDALQKEGMRVMLDNSGKSSGFKFYEWEMKGVPVRIEVGPRDIEKKVVTLAMRAGGNKMQVPEKDAVKKIKEIFGDIHKEISRSARAAMAISDSKDYSSLKKLSETEGKIHGFIRANFCGRDETAHKCATKLQDETGLKVRGTRLDIPEKPEKDAKCIVCGKPAKEVVYLARSY